MFDELKEGIDYHNSPLGYRIMTSKFLAEKGYCCSNKCKNCPYEPKHIKGNTILASKFKHFYKE